VLNNNKTIVQKNYKKPKSDIFMTPKSEEALEVRTSLQLVLVPELQI